MKSSIIFLCTLAASIFGWEAPNILEKDIQVPGSNGIVNEEMPPTRSFAESSTVITHQKHFLYGSLSIVPGGGITCRNRDGLEGTSLDYKLGVFPFVFDTVTLIPVISVDYNYLHFFKMNETSPYLSYGIGAAYVVPYIPLRAGIEFKHGFVDVGAKMVLGFIPSPEIRAGVGLKF